MMKIWKGESMSKQFTITSCVDGQIMRLHQVKDPIFAQRLAGDGIAISPKDTHFYAPVSGIVRMVFNSHHAFVIENDEGYYILVHIGINTLQLNGKGFTPHATQGTKVNAGDLMVTVDQELLEDTNIDLTTVILLMNHQDRKMIDKIEHGPCKAKETIVMTVTY